MDACKLALILSLLRMVATGATDSPRVLQIPLSFSPAPRAAAPRTSPAGRGLAVSLGTSALATHAAASPGRASGPHPSLQHISAPALCPLISGPLPPPPRPAAKRVAAFTGAMCPRNQGKPSEVTSSCLALVGGIPGHIWPELTAHWMDSCPTDHRNFTKIPPPPARALRTPAHLTYSQASAKPPGWQDTPPTDVRRSTEITRR